MKVKCSHCISIVVFALIVTTLIIVVCHNWWDNPRLLNETLSKYGPRAPHRIPTAMELNSDFGHLASTVTSNVLPRRLLFMTASYTFAQFHSLQKTLDCMRDICNAGWDVTVLLQTANGFNSSHPIYAEVVDRAFCLRTMASIPIVVEQFGQIGFGLNAQHRVYMRERLDDFDYFSYGEEDMQLTLSHLTAYISAEQTLRAAMSREQWLRYFPGFLRFEDSLIGAERVTWEYMPHQVHVVDLSSAALPGRRLGRYVVTNNLNQAIFVLSREHVRHLEDSCDFLSRPGQNRFYRELRRAQNKEWKYLSVGVSEWSSSFQQVLQCGMRRVVPADHLQLHMIHHGSNIAQKRRLRKELLTHTSWMQLVGNLSAAPRAVEDVYERVVFEQYNLHLIDGERLRGEGVKWAWRRNQSYVTTSTQEGVR